MKYLLKVTFVGATLLGASAPSLAQGDAEAGAEKAEACRACHGSRGISVNDMWPNLAGQKEAYLVKQMKAFRDGDRKDPIMTSFALSLSDEDIADLAAYYASLESAEHDADWYNRREQQKTY